MRILADENIDAVMVGWLREQGHEVIWAAETFPGSVDSDLLEKTYDRNLILLTRDLDFGELIFRKKCTAHGIILLRIHAHNQHERLDLFKRWWPEIQSKVTGNFITVSNDRIRLRSLNV